MSAFLIYSEKKKKTFLIEESKENKTKQSKIEQSPNLWVVFFEWKILLSYGSLAH